MNIYKVTPYFLPLDQKLNILLYFIFKKHLYIYHLPGTILNTFKHIILFNFHINPMKEETKPGG